MDMSLAGDLYIDYAIKVTGIISDPNRPDIATNSANSVTTSFNLRIKNPCLDPKYVKIIPSDLDHKTYELGSYKDSQPPGIGW